ncbi:MAG: hypothetical protein II417_00730 [Elusimicrobia bacterium]|nr:hypothetical protein [Elusimicrobiota bacterium]
MEFLLLILFVWNVILSIKLYKTNERANVLITALDKLLERRKILIKDSLKNIILEIEEMQKQNPTNRTRSISDDLVNDWIFKEEE